MNGNTDYALVFDGEVVAGCAIDQVKSNLSKGLKLSDVQIERLFSGKKTTIKRDISLENAISIKKAFLTRGAIVELIKLSGDVKTELQTNSADVLPHAVLFQFGKLISVSGITVGILLFLGLGLVVLYSPVPEMIVRRGFVIGLVVLGLASRYLVRLLIR